MQNDGKPDEKLGVRVTEVCEELRKRSMDVCCLQEVRWIGQGSQFIGEKGRRYKLWWQFW